MAYGNKYYLDVQDYMGETFRVQILGNGWGGSNTEIEKGEASPAALSYQDGSWLFDKILKMSELRVSFMDETGWQWTEFHYADSTDYIVQLISDPSGSPTTLWTGIYQSGMYGERYIDAPYSINLTFQCGLNYLSNIAWDNSGTLYTGLKHMLEILRRALNKLPYQLEIREVVNVYDDNQSSATNASPLTQTYIQSEAFTTSTEEGDDVTEEAWKCSEVISEMLRPFGVKIYQSNNIWWIYRIQDYQTTQMRYRQYAAAVGSESGTTLSTSGSITTTITIPSTNKYWKDESAYLDVNNKIEDLQITYESNNTRPANELIRNGAFGLWSGASMPPSYWTMAGLTYATYQRRFTGYGDGERRYAMLVFFEPELGASRNTSNYIQQTHEIVTTTSDSATFSFDVRILYSGEFPLRIMSAAKALVVYIDVEIKIGSYYLVGSDFPIPPSTTETAFAWTTTPGYCRFRISAADYGYDTMLERCFLSSGDPSKIFRITIDAPVFPENTIDDFYFKILIPYHNRSLFGAGYSGIVEHIQVGNVYGIYRADDSSPIISQVTKNVITDRSHEESMKVMFGDGPSAIALSSYRLSTGVPTDSWARRGVSESKSIIQILADSIIDMRGKYTRRVRGNTVFRTARLEVWNRVAMTVGGDTTKYMLTAFTWDIKNRQYSIVCEEIDSTSASGTIIDHKEKGLEPSRDNPGGLVGPPVIPHIGGMVPSPVVTITPATPIKHVVLSKLSAYPS